jgi:hypothetical protein
MIRVIQIPLPIERLKALPKEERALFLLMGYAANQITMFRKLLVFSSNKTPDDSVEQRISGAQTQMLARFLIGIEHEAWKLIKNRFLGSPIGREYQKRLNSTGKEALESLKRYFASSNMVDKVRNNYAYHHPFNEDVDAAFQVAADDSDWDDYWKLYLSDSATNSFHFASDVVVAHGMMHAINETDIAVAHQKIMEESSRVAKLMTELILDFVAAFVANNFSIPTSSSEILGQECEPIANAPDVLKFWLPFYVEL